MSWFNVIKVRGQGGMSPQEQTASTKDNQKLLDRANELGIKMGDPRLRGNLDPVNLRAHIREEERRRQQPKSNANSEAIRTVARNVEAKNRAKGKNKESVGAAAMRAMAEGKDPTKAGMATVARNVKLPDSRLTPQERAEQNKQRNLKNQTPLPVIDRPLTREERMQRNENKKVSLPQKTQPPQETKTVPLPDSAKNQLRRDSQSTPLPKPEELSPDVKQKLQRQVGQVVNPPVEDRAKPLGDTLDTLEARGRNRRDKQLAAIRARRKEIQLERQKNANAPSSGGL